MRNFEEQLSGGHPNSLGNTVAVVEQVLETPEYFEELFNCYFSQDEVVRLRVSSAMKRICIATPEMLMPYIDRFLEEISKIDQPSTKWTLALLFEMLFDHMSDTQQRQAKAIIRYNLESETDWIVLNNSMGTLTKWSKNDSELQDWLVPKLRKLLYDPRKSVAGKARKMLRTQNLT